MNTVTRATACAAAIASMALLAGCHGEATASSAMTLADVQVAGRNEVDDARRRASEAYHHAARELAEARRRLHRTTVDGERAIAAAEARAEYAIGRKRCETLDHDARLACSARVQKRFQQALTAAERIEYAYIE